MQKEIRDHEENKNWEIVKRKGHVSTREVYKWKARLTIDGSNQKYGLHYNETYSL
jgi:hypothetical protein